MKKSKYQLLDILKNREQQAAEEMITTQNLADEMGLSRGVVSLYLSQLFEEGLVEKYGTKPVYWRTPAVSEPKSHVFEAFIGGQGSLKQAIDQCQAAVHYPPNGLPVMITGDSGVGKSYLASLICQYAQEQKVIGADKSFIALNCADYANNPELLSSVLFGYKKGAFTGATEDQSGLVAQADGGYLFLDEVHRLNNENQEKLFNLLDSGTYYPLGENKKPSTASVRFIFATTEALDDTLLHTFQRRVPMHIELTPYADRPLKERLALIFQIFHGEARQLDRDLCVSKEWLVKLIRQQAKGNIGSLRNQIKLLCAAAYTQTDETAEYLAIGETQPDDLKVLKGEQTLPTFFTVELTTRQLLLELNEHAEETDLSHKKLIVEAEIKKIAEQLYGHQAGDAVVQVFYQQLLGVLNPLAQRYGILQKIPNDALQKCGVVVALLEGAHDLEWDLSWWQQTVKKYPRSRYLLRKILQDFTKMVGQPDLANHELLQGLFFLLLFGDKVAEIEAVNFTSILLSHGTMASSIQTVVNSLCKNFVFEAFDMPIDVSVKEITAQVTQHIEELTVAHGGVILMFDMGSLSEIYKEVKNHVATDLLVLNNLTTSMALDVALRVSQQASFREIAEKAEDYAQTTRVQYYEGLSQNKNIIVSCMSGVGLSEEIRKTMQACLNKETEIITMDYKDLKKTLATHDTDYFSNTRFILTTAEIAGVKGIEILNIYNIMEQGGALHLRRLLLENGEHPENINQMMEQLLQFFTIEGISDRLQFLNPKVVIREVQEIIEKYERYYNLNLEGKTKLNLYMHIALMLERMLVSSRNSEKLTGMGEVSDEEKHEFFSISKNIFHNVELKYNIVIDDYELSLMYELLKTTF